MRILFNANEEKKILQICQNIFCEINYNSLELAYEKDMQISCVNDIRITLHLIIVLSFPSIIYFKH